MLSTAPSSRLDIRRPLGVEFDLLNMQCFLFCSAVVGYAGCMVCQPTLPLSSYEYLIRETVHLINV